jgi:arabinoxylan arabinofuranohydrolase
MKTTLRNISRIAVLLLWAFTYVANAQNPFLPSWEYIPDGEPRVFGDRVYLYGSHDKAGSKTFCDKQYRVWSAPLSDLTDWRNEGNSFQTIDYEEYADDVPWTDNDLYAPDVVEKDGKYYLYAYIVGAPGCVAVSDNPGGPFKLVSKYKAPEGSPNDFGGWGQYIDPGVLVDDDGRVYIYWGYKSSHMAEINPDNMYEILPNTYQADIIPTTPPFNFFEGASPRKINGTYYLMYADGGILVYATSDKPTGPFKYGGPIIRNGNEYPGGNIHGSLCELNGQWYIFYHRMTHNTIMSRKACVERVKFEKDGSIKEVEMTSLGFKESLNPYEKTEAYIACVLKGGNYIIEESKYVHPVILNKNNCVIGFKYYDFGKKAGKSEMDFTANIKGGKASGKMEIWIDSDKPEKGTKIGTLDIYNTGAGDCNWRKVSTKVQPVEGRRAVFLKFVSDDQKETICDFESFVFSKAE